MRKLAIAEMFYSIQGEGRTMGAPSFFIRLAGCNLMCGGPGTEKDGLLHDGATWRCDSIEVWRKGKLMTFDEILAELKAYDFFDKVSQGAHIIFTGGEPLLQQEGIKSFIEHLITLNLNPIIEIETNGTIIPIKALLKYIQVWNVSPKLSNSGMNKGQRFNKQALLNIFSNAIGPVLKLVISSEKDWEEAKRDYIDVFELPFGSLIGNHNVYLMPAVDNMADYPEACQLVIEICKRECVNFSGRAHISIYDQKTGV